MLIKKSWFEEAENRVSDDGESYLPDLVSMFPSTLSIGRFRQRAYRPLVMLQRLSGHLPPWQIWTQVPVKPSGQSC